jgi:hypothetical protein
MRRTLLLVPVVAALAFAAQAGASSRAAHITLNVNDTFTVAGTNLACEIEVGKKLLKGQKLVTCFKVNGSKLVPGSYVSALGDSGRVVIAKIKPDGTVSAPVFNRAPSSLGAHAKQYAAKVGDELVIAKTDIACTVNSDTAGIYPTCFRVTTKGGRPHSYAFAEGTKFVAVVQFDATGTKTTIVYKHLQ